MPVSSKRPSGFSTFRAGGKIAAMVFASVLLMPLQWVVQRFTNGRATSVLPRLWFRCLRAAMGIRVDVVGTPREGGGTVFVGNHVSHFDILVLGSLLRARFIAKDDMERWPGMRFIGELGQTLFISRKRSDAANVAASLSAKMQAGQDLVLFPEGTTSSGEQVAPFKSSLFSLFIDKDGTGAAWTLQPFTLDVVSVDGHALSAGADRDIYAFHGGMDAGAHVKRFLRLSGALVRVVFHPPVTVTPDTDRKALAARLHAVVASGLRGEAAAASTASPS
ncbi:1-acyl-sn-glycerol-3-phosphate acyltransferase [Bacillus sp. NP157]|nr:1-acyl-sn-glycerol-3-phosphate acyltransferase [Bacillus sp. NP157]